MQSARSVRKKFTNNSTYIKVITVVFFERSIYLKSFIKIIIMACICTILKLTIKVR